ncbi:GATA zinc finger domain-containing protein 14 isoform X2 [Patella vulgata]|uniref:GATA zinc finger domain-containing protein 14 isoform X2 n=1 Tax=Patella vulgata TaxID=6465 RepID=UPI0021808135|nr:GATA zinc finger domain-containing protein 14 isoform X2 [Patella vulgata]
MEFKSLFLVIALFPLVIRSQEEYCGGKPADVVFLLDASNSIWGPDFKKQLEFVQNIVSMFNIGENYTQVGMATFNRHTDLQFHLNTYHKKEDLIEAIGLVEETYGDATNTADAVRFMRREMFSPRHGSRKGVPRVGVIITDGQSSNILRTVFQASRAKRQHINLFAIGVGDLVNARELRGIASKPSMEYMFQVLGYGALGSVRNILAVRTCAVSGKPKKLTTPVFVRRTTTNSSSTNKQNGGLVHENKTRTTTPSFEQTSGFVEKRRKDHKPPTSTKNETAASSKRGHPIPTSDIIISKTTKTGNIPISTTIPILSTRTSIEQSSSDISNLFGRIGPPKFPPFHNPNSKLEAEDFITGHSENTSPSGWLPLDPFDEKPSTVSPNSEDARNADRFSVTDTQHTPKDQKEDTYSGDVNADNSQNNNHDTFTGTNNPNNNNELTNLDNNNNKFRAISNYKNSLTGVDNPNNKTNQPNMNNRGVNHHNNSNKRLTDDANTYNNKRFTDADNPYDNNNRLTDADNPYDNNKFTDVEHLSNNNKFADVNNPINHNKFTNSENPNNKKRSRDVDNPNKQNRNTDAENPNNKNRFTDAETPNNNNMFTDGDNANSDYRFTEDDNLNKNPNNIFRGVDNPNNRFTNVNNPNNNNSRFTDTDTPYKQNRFTDAENPNSNNKFTETDNLHNNRNKGFDNPNNGFRETDNSNNNNPFTNADNSNNNNNRFTDADNPNKQTRITDAGNRNNNNTFTGTYYPNNNNKYTNADNDRYTDEDNLNNNQNKELRGVDNPYNRFRKTDDPDNNNNRFTDADNLNNNPNTRFRTIDNPSNNNRFTDADNPNNNNNRFTNADNPNFNDRFTDAANKFTGAYNPSNLPNNRFPAIDNPSNNNRFTDADNPNYKNNRFTDADNPNFNNNRFTNVDNQNNNPNNRFRSVSSNNNRFTDADNPNNKPNNRFRGADKAGHKNRFTDTDNPNNNNHLNRDEFTDNSNYRKGFSNSYNSNNNNKFPGSTIPIDEHKSPFSGFQNKRNGFSDSDNSNKELPRCRNVSPSSSGDIVTTEEPKSKGNDNPTALPHEGKEKINTTDESYSGDEDKATTTTTPPPPKPTERTMLEPACRNKKADIVFAIDSSNGINRNDYWQQIRFVREVARRMDIGENKTRVGLIVYTDQVLRQFDLSDHTNMKPLLEAIISSRRSAGGTRIDNAVRYVRTKSFRRSLSRPGAAQVAVFIAGSKSRNIHKTKKEAGDARSAGMTLFSIGVGKGYSKDEMHVISKGNKGWGRHGYFVDDFDQIETIIKDLTIQACRTKPTETPLTNLSCGFRQQADLMFVVDSANAGRTNTKKTLEFVRDVSKSVDIDQDNVHVGLMSAGCDAGEEGFSLGAHRNEQAMKDAISRNQRGTDISKLLKDMRRNSFSSKEGGRKDAKKVAVVVVDGQLEQPLKALREARFARIRGVEVYVVAVGNGEVQKEIEMMCDDPLQKHFFRVENYDQLKGLKTDLVDMFCDEL